VIDLAGWWFPFAVGFFVGGIGTGLLLAIQLHLRDAEADYDDALAEERRSRMAARGERFLCLVEGDGPGPAA